MRKVTAKELSLVKSDLIRAQGGRCPLCDKSLHMLDAVVDHNHFTGQIRGALHSGCNRMEGSASLLPTLQILLPIGHKRLCR